MAATGTSRVPDTTHGDKPGMGDPDPRDAARDHLRRQLARDLGPYRTHLAGLLDHIDHMDQGDLDRLQHVLVMLQGREPAGRGEILEALQSIHDVDQCQEDLEREGLLEPEPEPERASVVDRLRRAFQSPRE